MNRNELPLAWSPVVPDLVWFQEAHSCFKNCKIKTFKQTTSFGSLTNTKHIEPASLLQGIHDPVTFFIEETLGDKSTPFCQNFCFWILILKVVSFFLQKQPGGVVQGFALKKASTWVNALLNCQLITTKGDPVLWNSRTLLHVFWYFMPNIWNSTSFLQYASAQPSAKPAITRCNFDFQQVATKVFSKTCWHHVGQMKFWPLLNRMPILTLTAHWFSRFHIFTLQVCFTTSSPFHYEIARIHRFVASTSSPILKRNFQDGCISQQKVLHNISPGFCICFWVCANDALISAPSSVPTWEVILMDR